MSLSVCMTTADPPSRVATILEPLRALAQETIITADGRVDEETLAGYAALADHLFRIEHTLFERHLAWLHAQCSSEWVLRLDGDEIPSEAFVERLPALLCSRRVQQYWIARAWVYPDAEHTLEGSPWEEDFVNRLTRNDGTLRFNGRQHAAADPVVPCEYIEQPLYHLELMNSSGQQRMDKAIFYECARPGVRADGGGRINEAFYLPELRESLEFRSIPPEDRARVARFLADIEKPASASTEQTSVEQVPFVSQEEMDRLWEGRTVSADAYRAKIEPYRPSLSLIPSENRRALFFVHNLGGERWPAFADENPQIRFSYRWLTPDGNVHTPEGPRSAFQRVVEPGERVLAAMHIDAPNAEGEYILEVDIMHWGVRWFNCACRVPVWVRQQRDLPPTGTRLRETCSPPFRRWRRMRIPRIIHRVWLGTKTMPEEQKRFGEMFARHNPGWERRMWTDEDLSALDISATERGRARTPSELSNLVRYEVLSRHGGVYVDTDVECLRPLTPLLRGIDAFAALEQPGRVGSAVLGSVAGHPVFVRAARLARRTLGIGDESPNANGPYFLTLLLEQEPGFTIFGSRYFYPYTWEEPERRHESFPDAYAVHHWTGSWVSKNGVECAEDQEGELYIPHARCGGSHEADAEQQQGEGTAREPVVKIPLMSRSGHRFVRLRLAAKRVTPPWLWARLKKFKDSVVRRGDPPAGHPPQSIVASVSSSGGSRSSAGEPAPHCGRTGAGEADGRKLSGKA